MDEAGYKMYFIRYGVINNAGCSAVVAADNPAESVSLLEQAVRSHFDGHARLSGTDPQFRPYGTALTLENRALEKGVIYDSLILSESDSVGKN